MVGQSKSMPRQMPGYARVCPGLATPLTTTTSLEANDDEFGTPNNHSGVYLIQPLTQSPHVPGKTPHAANTMMKSKLFASTTAPASITTDSPSHYATENNTSLILILSL